MSVDKMDREVFKELKESPSPGAYFSSTGVKLSECEVHVYPDRFLQPDQKSEIYKKLTIPFLTSPPDLIRRFADCDFTGDCHSNEVLNPEVELPCRSSLPGDNMPSPSFLESLESGSGSKDCIFGSSSSDAQLNLLHVEFKPLKDIFHLFGKTLMFKKP